MVGLLPEPTLQQRIATGFNRNHRGNAEGGIIPEEYQVEYVVDRVDTTFTVWLSLTIGCARCHDHKFDPIKQSEFYQLFAFLNQVDEPSIEAPSESELESIKQYDSKLSKLEIRLKELAKDSEDRKKLTAEITNHKKSFQVEKNFIERFKQELTVILGSQY